MRQKCFHRIAFRYLGLPRLAFRAAAVLLLAITAASAMDAAGMALPPGSLPGQLSGQHSAHLASPPAFPGGCHGHEGPAYPAVPVMPRSYQCCITGHHIAILSASFSLPLVLACVREAGDAAGFSFATTAHVPTLVLIFPSSSPPGGVALRI